MNRRVFDVAVAAFSLVAGFAYFQWVWKPIREDRREIAERIRRTMADIAKSEQYTRGKEELQRYLEEFEDALAQLDRLVPTHTDVHERVREGSALVQQCGLRDDAIIPKEPLENGAVTAHPVTFTLTGDYSGLMRFLFEAEALERYTRVTRLQVKPGEREGELQIEVDLTSYTMGEDAS